MQYRVLGPLEVRDGEESLPLAGAKQRALLALLLLHANRVLSRDRLIDELWGGEPPATAVTSLQVYVSRLRKLLPPETLLTRPPGYLLAVDPNDLDLQRFEHLLTQGHEALGGGDAEEAARVLHEALTLWRGPALAEFAFEPFAQNEIARLEDLRLGAVEERIEADLALGRHADVIGELEALIGENPHRERLRGQLILALYRSGRQADALDAYQQARRALDELGIEPSAELQELEKGILTHDPALSVKARRNLPSGTVTYLFTDVEESTRLLQELGDRYVTLLEEHRKLLREVFEKHGGVEVDTQGDAFFVAFGSARGAVAAAQAAQDRLTGPLRIRIGLHTGEAELTGGGYVGIDVNRAARIAAAAHGGQVLLSQSTRDLVDADVRDLGVHRLKALSAPERLYQVGLGEFPPIRTIAHTNLPLQPTPLVGRERELAEVLELVVAHRLVTLTGAGGSGKTRLALQAAAELLDDFPDGVWFVSLAPLTDPELVEPSIAQALGAPRELEEFLRGKQLLLVIDNLEQLLPGVAPIVARLDANVLATSREHLNVTAEQEYPVPPLPLNDAVALFTQRARQLEPAFEADEHAAEIARRLDGLPLALELAAARVNVLSAAAILERLDKRLPLLTGGARDVPERQLTLRATIDWSYELLSTEEQCLFARLAVFAGGCTLGAAERVSSAELDTLASLVDKNLLLHHGDRYSMLETIREYAAEKLEASGEGDALRRRHTEHFLALAERAERLLTGQEIPLANVPDERQVVRELPNLRAALEWTFDQGELELALRLAAAAGSGWYLSAGFTEGRGWVGRALEETPHLQTLARARALSRVAGFAAEQGDFRSGDAFHEQALTLYEQHRDQRGVIRSLLGLSYGALMVGDLERARVVLKEAGTLADELGSDWDRAEVCFSGASLEALSGDYAHALALEDEGVRLMQRLGMPRRVWLGRLVSVGYYALLQRDFVRARTALEEYLAEDADKSPLGIANAHSNLGLVSLYERDHEGAAAHFRQALVLCGEAGAKRTIAEALYGLAAVAAIDGDGERSACLWGAADAILESTGSPVSEPEQFIVQHYLEPTQAALADDLHLRARANGGWMSLDEVRTYALEQVNSAADP
jgi:predicted ATPase/DNA-binding SARP family transcriptional activator